MDKNIPIKMFLDSLIENNDILMCKVIGEKSGSTLIKLRVKDPKNGGQCNVGEVTQKSKVEFKPVTLKQVKKDCKIGSQKRDGDVRQEPIEKLDIGCLR